MQGNEWKCPFLTLLYSNCIAPKLMKFQITTCGALQIQSTHFYNETLTSQLTIWPKNLEGARHSLNLIQYSSDPFWPHMKICLQLSKSKNGFQIALYSWIRYLYQLLGKKNPKLWTFQSWSTMNQSFQELWLNPWMKLPK